jgi:TP901 family phage tail tape measure protein
MKQLDFTLSLIDKLSRPLKQVQNNVTGFAEKSTAAFTKIGGGVLALAGTGMAIKGALSPAIEMYDALNEAAAKGIDDSALKTVQRDALTFSTTYGASAVQFVQSTESINAAIAGLTGNELPKVTKVANVLAFAMKSTAAETSEFMGQMFGNFSSDAARLGKVQFAEQLAGKMVYMRKTFGAEMATIKDLMEGARGVGTNYGVGLDEQLAVLGQLSRTLGTEASSAYEGFMTGAIDGAKKLGLSFTDATGKMLSMPEMLAKLQGKYGKSLEGNLKAQAELDEAFGDSSAVVKQLYGNVALLQRNITELGGADGLKRTQEMAARMVKPWDRFIAILTAIKTVIGLTLIPVLYPLLNRLADMGQTFSRWMQLFPNIARVVGYAALALLGFAAVGAIANIVMGVSTFVMMGMTKVLAPVARLLGLNRLAMLANNAVTKLFTAGLRGLRAALLAASIAARVGSASFLLMIAPIAAVALAIAGVVLAVIKFWQPIKAFVSGFIRGFSQASGALTPFKGLFSGIATAVGWVWNGVKTLFGWFGNLLSPVQMTGEKLAGVTSAGETFGRVVAGAVGLVLTPFELVYRSIQTVIEMFGIVIDGWGDVVNAFDINSPVASFEKMASVIGGVFGKLWETLKGSFTGTYNWIIEKLNKLPGVDIALAADSGSGANKGIPFNPKQVEQAAIASPEIKQVEYGGNITQQLTQNTLLPEPPPVTAPNVLLTGGELKGVERGGISKTINSNSKSVTDNSRKIDTVNIYPKETLSPGQLQEWQELNP